MSLWPIAILLLRACDYCVSIESDLLRWAQHTSIENLPFKAFKLKSSKRASIGQASSRMWKFSFGPLTIAFGQPLPLRKQK